MSSHELPLWVQQSLENDPRVGTAAGDFFVTNLPPGVSRGAIPCFYLCTGILTSYLIGTLHFTFVEHRMKWKAMPIFICCIEVGLILVPFVCMAFTLPQALIGKINPPEWRPKPRFKDWAQFSAILLIEFLIVVLLLEIATRSRRSGKFIFKRTSSATGYISLRSLTSTSYFRLNDRSAAGIHASNAGIAMPDLLVPIRTDADERHLIEDSNSFNTGKREPYTYSPLAQGDIRLLHVQSCENSTNLLQVSLEHIPLLSAQSRTYVALSYTWGLTEADVPILMDDGVLRIRPNLARILRILRDLQVKYVWIDAICVNQADSAERNAQVVRMRAIYVGAKEVLVAADTAITGKCDELVPILNLIEPTVGPTGQKAQVADLLKTMRVNSAIETLCNDSYWSRLWIIQEFALGAKAKILFGSNVVDAARVKWLLDEVGTRMEHRHRDRIHNLYSIRRAWQSDTPLQLIQLLHRTSGSRCSVRHDRVFGLVGLSPDALRYLPEPDYETDLITATLAMTRAYIEKTSADLILLAPHRMRVPALPSWSVDFFNLDHHPFEERIFSLVVRRQIYRVTPSDVLNPKIRYEYRTQQPRSWTATGSISSHITFRGNTMQTSAGRIGTIRSLGKAWSDPIDCSFPIHDPTWRRIARTSHLLTEMATLMLHSHNLDTIEGYSLVKVFLTSHGTYDAEHSDADLQRWICGNRNFFTGVRSLEELAESLPHPLLSYGLKTYTVLRDDMNESRLGVFHYLASRAKEDMRMMCLDAGPKWRTGWAAKGAMLHDEVFLIPGCSSSVILRKNDNGRYQVVGDAIVYGGIWSQLNADDISHIEII